MGKKNKKGAKYKNAWDNMGYIEQEEFLRDSAEKYGIDMGSYSRFGDVSGARGNATQSYSDLETSVARAAQNDYSNRRALEAASMAGNERAQAISSMNEGIQQVAATEKWMEKMHGKHVGGGDYTWGSDPAGVAMHYVERDRQKFTNEIQREIDRATGEDEQDGADTNENNENLSYNEWRESQGLQPGDPSPSNVIQLDGIDGSRRDEANSFLQSEIEKVTARDRARSKATMGEYVLNQIAGN